MGPAQAQDQSTDPDIQRLENEKKRVELEYDIEKKKDELFRLRLPQSQTEPLAGSIDVDEKFALPSQILVYRAVDEIVARARIDLIKSSPDVRTFVVFSEKEFAFVAAYTSALAQFRALQRRYDELLPKDADLLAFAPIAAADIAAALLGSAANVIAFFRTEVVIKSTDVSVQKEAVIAALANALGNERTLVYPPIFFPQQLFFKHSSTTSTLSNELSALLTRRMRSAEEIRSFDSKTPEEQAKDPLKDNVPKLKALNDQFDRLVTALTVPDEMTGISPLSNLLRGELLHVTLAGSDTRILVIEIIAAGGANKTSRNLFTGMFTGTRLYHQGGTVISLMLLDTNGGIAFARTYWATTEFVNFNSEREWKMISGFSETARE